VNVASPDQAARDQATLTDIVRACDLTQRFVDGLDLEAFLADEKTQAAVLHEITIIGEAVKRLSHTVRDARPSIPWRLMAGMRDRLVHDYNTVDLEEVWKTVMADIPALVAQLDDARPSSQESSNQV
jgi:uncharacterized protein with HEPN domain